MRIAQSRGAKISPKRPVPTPMIVDTEWGTQIIMNGERFARCYDLKSGKELWRCGGQTQRPVASAVAIVLLVLLVLPIIIFQRYQAKASEAP